MEALLLQQTMAELDAAQAALREADTTAGDRDFACRSHLDMAAPTHAAMLLCLLLFSHSFAIADSPSCWKEVSRCTLTPCIVWEEMCGVARADSLLGGGWVIRGCRK
jgi:hypothetical protein